MSTALQSAASRANGTKSVGPTTEAGLEKSSRNALAHGFAAEKLVLLDCENPEEYEIMTADYAAMYQPASPLEVDLVHRMVAARWRMDRLMAVETSLVNRELAMQELRRPPSNYCLAGAFSALADKSGAYSLVTRYQSRLLREHERCFALLRILQQERRTAQLQAQPAAPQPAQPEPSASHLASTPQPAPAEVDCALKPIWRNEPAAARSIRPLRLNLHGFAPRFTPQRSARRCIIG